jgi:hypothetical protein
MAVLLCRRLPLLCSTSGDATATTPSGGVVRRGDELEGKEEGERSAETLDRERDGGGEEKKDRRRAQDMRVITSWDERLDP